MIKIVTAKNSQRMLGKDSCTGEIKRIVPEKSGQGMSIFSQISIAHRG